MKIRPAFQLGLWALIGATACPSNESDEPVDAGDETITLQGDYSCWRQRTAPDGGTPPEPISFDVQDPLSPSKELEGLTMEAYPDNKVGPKGSGLVATTDKKGEVTFDLVSNRWFAYRITDERKDKSQFTTVGQNRMAVAGTKYVQPSLATGSIDLIPFSLSRDRVPGTAIISGTFTDCAGKAGVGVKMRVFRDNEELLSSKTRTGFVIAYFTSFLPSDTEPGTTESGSGRFSILNVPTNGTIRVEAWQYVRKTPKVRIGCEVAQLFPDTASIVSFGPERADYADDSPCKR